MRRKLIPHDPFHDNAPQVPSHVLPPKPPDLESIDSDESRGGKNVKPVKITDEKFDSAFKHEPEHTKEYDFIKGKSKMDDAQTKIANFAILAERSLKQNLCARHPKLLRAPTDQDDIRNAQVIDAIFLERANAGEWEFNDANYEAAYAIAKNAGQITVLPEPPPIPGQFSSPEEFIQQAPLKQVEQALRNVETSKLPRNYAAELLTGEGSYRWNAVRDFEQPQMTEEALAALRNGMRGKP